MMYEINKGVGRPLDFFGLKSRYILYFVVGIGLAFVAFFLVRLINEIAGYVAAGIIAAASYFVCNYLNSKFGVNGISHKLAMKTCPERVSPIRAKSLVKITSRRK